MSQPNSGREHLKLDEFLKRIEGSWYVVESNLDMWKLDKNPIIKYGKFKPKVRKLKDTVSRTASPCCFRWQENIVGWDSLKGEKNGKLLFEWSGTGCQSWVTSDWVFHAIGTTEGEEWAITTFDKTFFTGAGADFYSRTPTLSQSSLQAINELVMNDKEISEYTEMNGGMFKCMHDNPNLVSVKAVAEDCVATQK